MSAISLAGYKLALWYEVFVNVRQTDDISCCVL
jgi:hypothetical protein